MCALPFNYTYCTDCRLLNGLTAPKPYINKQSITKTFSSFILVYCYSCMPLWEWLRNKMGGKVRPESGLNLLYTSRSKGVRRWPMSLYFYGMIIKGIAINFGSFVFYLYLSTPPPPPQHTNFLTWSCCTWTSGIVSFVALRFQTHRIPRQVLKYHVHQTLIFVRLCDQHFFKFTLW